MGFGVPIPPFTGAAGDGYPVCRMDLCARPGFY